MPSSLNALGVASDELGLHRQLVTGEAHGLTGQLLRHARHLEHHAPGLDHCDPALGRALTGTHAGLGRLLRVRLVREDVDPDLAATLDLARHGDTRRLDLAVREPPGLDGLQAVVAEVDGLLAAREPGPAAAMDLAELDSLGRQHLALAPLARTRHRLMPP